MRVLSLVGLVGCAPPPGSCLAPLVGACVDYPSLAQAQADCPTLAGTADAGTCEPSSSLGSCTVGEHVRHYLADAEPAWQPTSAEAHCLAVLGGAWTAAPAR